MPKVNITDLSIQSGTTDTLYAKWEFVGSTTTTASTGVIKAGDTVTITGSGATYYNGVSIPPWVKEDRWIVAQVSGDRAVLGKNVSGTINIQSAINVKYLSNGSSSSTTTNINTLDHYKVSWWYDSGDGVWFDGGSSDVEQNERFSYADTTYTMPSNAISVIVWVQPIAKTHTVNEQEVAYWTGTITKKRFYANAAPPDNVSAPSVSIDKYTLTATLDNISDAKADEIYFAVYKNISGVFTQISTCSCKVSGGKSSYTLSVETGGEYRVRCKAVNINGKSKIYSNAWSGYSDSVFSMPSTPLGFKTCKAESETSVYLDWDAVEGSSTYEIEYTTNKNYFGITDQTTIISDIDTLQRIITGLSTGEEYFFRLRAVSENDSNAKSEWSEISSTPIGTKPNAPTTWSSSTTVIVGEPLYLYWVHNSEDGSSQTYAELDLYIDGEEVLPTIIITNSTEPDEKDRTSQYYIDTSEYTEGTKIDWRVRTSGVTNELGDWSVMRTVDIYASPTLQLSCWNDDQNGSQIDTITSFPFYIKGLAGPNTQSPIGYHLEIASNDEYEAIDYMGQTKHINSGDIVYSKYFDTNDNPLMVEFTPGNIDLESDVEYTVTCTVTMNSGLSISESMTFNVEWEDVTYDINAEMAIDKENIAAYIRPYVSKTVITDELLDNISFSIFRRNSDGTFTEIESNIENGLNSTIIDPHPTLDYARYRIVATDESTGAISFYDAPDYPVQEKSIIIQWDEEWETTYTNNPAPMVSAPYRGTMLKLPYNIDVSEGNSKDVEFVNYIGRQHPVSYYGTHVGETSQWDTEIPKSDKETLYALRRLSKWMGNVYVREPSGLGYWASISVSFSQKHCELTIPISIDITRIEGGK